MGKKTKNNSSELRAHAPVSSGRVALSKYRVPRKVSLLYDTGSFVGSALTSISGLSPAHVPPDWVSESLFSLEGWRHSRVYPCVDERACRAWRGSR